MKYQRSRSLSRLQNNTMTIIVILILSFPITGEGILYPNFVENILSGYYIMRLFIQIRIANYAIDTTYGK